jgi:hypothetical protein
MDESHSTPDRGGNSSGPLRAIFTEAIRYWEPRRIIYNLILVAVVIAWIGSTWPHFRDALTLQSLLLVFILAMLANLCYCAAYLADIPIRYSAFHGAWRRWRWFLWLGGTIFAVVLANYWIVDEIYPFVR